ncbi:1-acyl-sn-glycerol-3-phosphate acyltransferase [bacterium]|nr:1-acyl-sn-glycerol-3-phosphate acyltransferase [bacterium]
MLHFVAHSGLFRRRLQSWFLRSCGVIPVFRPKDVSEAADRNVAMFSACHRLLVGGGAIGIFPEGTSAEERRVQKLKTGTARMALSAEAGADWGLGVTIVPVGLNFESRRRFRSRVLVRFGRPLAAADHREAYRADPVAAVNALTEELQDALRRRVVNVEHVDFIELVRDVEKVYKGELLERDGLEIPGDTRFKRDQQVTREIARALDYFYERSPEVIWGLSRLMRKYHSKRRLLRLKDELLRGERGPTVRGEVWRFVAAGAAGLPLALYGSVGNIVPYKLTGRISARLAPDLTKVHTYQFVVGAALFLPWYVALLHLVNGRFGFWWALAALVTLPLAGLFARAYGRRMKNRRRLMRLAWLELLQGVRLQDLRQQRRQLIRELDAALEEYMHSLEEDA